MPRPKSPLKSKRSNNGSNPTSSSCPYEGPRTSRTQFTNPSFLTPFDLIKNARPLGSYVFLFLRNTEF